jgi:hypothetical protein
MRLTGWSAICARTVRRWSSDGSDDNQAFQSTERGFTRVWIFHRQAAIQEFQVNTSNYSAQYGRAAGGGVNAIHEERSQRFSWQCFLVLETTSLAQPIPTRWSITSPVKPKDKRHQFDETFGGPLIKDKLLFFYTFDQQKRTFPIVQQELGWDTVLTTSYLLSLGRQLPNFVDTTPPAICEA